MTLYTDKQPNLMHPAHGRIVAKLPCVVLSAEEAVEFIEDDRQRRNDLYDEARILAEQIEPAPEEVLVYDPCGEVVTGITLEYRFVASAMEFD